MTGHLTLRLTNHAVSCVRACLVGSNSLWPPWTGPPGSSVCGIFQARIVEWVAISYSRGSSPPGVEPTSFAFAAFPALAGRFLTNAPPGKPLQSVWKRLFFLRKPYFKRSKNKQSHLHRGDQLGCLKIWNLHILRLCYLEVKKKRFKRMGQLFECLKVTKEERLHFKVK